MKQFLVSLVFLNVVSPLAAQSAAPPVPPLEIESTSGFVDYIRFSTGGTDPDRLQTAVVRFEKGGTTVDLVGVVHLGDSGYYQNLNEFLKGYDKVLYEMVGGEFQPREDASVSGGTPEEMAGVHSLQKLVKSFLGLEFQLDGIDYNATNFVHADVNWDEINALMTARNENLVTFITRAMVLAEKGDMAGLPSDEARITAGLKKLFSDLMAGDSASLKRTIAPLMSEAESFISQWEGEDGTVLVSERNRVVMEKLAEIRGDHPGGKYAIFFGAGHMPDLEKRLLADGFTKGESVWADAWTIPKGAVAADGSTAPAPSPADLLLKVLNENPEIISTIQQLGTMLEELGGAVKSLTPPLPPPVK